LTPPTGLGLLASAPRRGFSRPGSARLGLQKDGLPACRGDMVFSSAQGHQLAQGEGQPGRCPFLSGSGNGRQNARPYFAGLPVAVLRNLRLGGGSRCCWLGLSKSGRLLPLTLPQRFFSAHSAPFGQVFDFKVGAGEGNRTLVISLEVGGAPYRRTGVRDIA
jgi:hypothetical protein